jgi:putative DNA primase/helicase
MSAGDAVHEFAKAMQAAGLTPPEVIEPGKLHRFPTNGRAGDDAGWCKLFPDCEGGVFGDFRSGLSETWQAKREKPFSSAERKAFRQRCEAERRAREAEEARRRAEAACKAAEIWKDAPPATGDHPYLTRKNIKPHGARLYRGDQSWVFPAGTSPIPGYRLVRVPDPWPLIGGMPGDCLIVPLRDSGGMIHSLQFIAVDGTKRFLPGGRVQGCYFSIGRPKGTICICEGFASGGSVREATGHAVAVAFSAGNLKPVALALRMKFPKAKIILCADNDRFTIGNPGVTKAREAALAVQGHLAVPRFDDLGPYDYWRGANG